MSDIKIKSDGVLSIEKNNIFTILKKWLYTEQNVVFRELLSNACDAIDKRKKIDSEKAPSKITVILDKEKGKLIFQDTGIGMTYDEVDKYINQIAFSGAAEFIDNNKDNNTIIGHFGVGFYSAFTISDSVTIETKSYKEDAKAIKWHCTSDMSYSMTESSKSDVGTDIILDLDSDNEYFKSTKLVYGIIKKYFIFSPVPIYFVADGYDNVLINTPNPIWKLDTHIIDESEMKTYYKEYFDDVLDPLFWIKFESVDIGVRGILFFRDTKNGKEELDGTIDVYRRGVYVGTNMKEIIPKFVNLQSGIIECDNLPLVVSRSNIREENQNDSILGLIYECLSQEVTIALNDMFENKRSDYEKHWPNLNAFVKYSVLQDKVFASVMTRKVLFMDIENKYHTIKEYTDNIAAKKHPDTIYYSSDSIEQAHYIEIFRKCGLNALLFDHVIDQPFMRKYEVVKPNLKFIRIDSNIESLFSGQVAEQDEKKADVIKERIIHALGDRLNGMQVKVTNLEYDAISSIIINDEKSRRMADMLELYGMISEEDFDSKKLQSKSIFLANMSNDIIDYIYQSTNQQKTDIIVNQLFDLALMSQQNLKAEDVENFILRSESILQSSIN